MSSPAISDSMAHVLIVDDDRRIRELLQSFLAGNGLRVTTAASAAEGRERMRGLAFDLIILDVMMKGENGLELAASLRADGNSVPILMLSALAETGDRISGLESGSDDYLTKPFEPRELLLRVQSILRRQERPQMARGEIRFGACHFHIGRGELRRDGIIVRLTPRERELLRILALRPGQPVSRVELSQPGLDDAARSVDVQINRLRRKIEEDPAAPVYLQTARGSGYTLFTD